MTDVPVAEAAERLRAALAALAVGEKVKLYPADVRALLEHYDRHAAAEPAVAAEPDQDERAELETPELSEVKLSLKGLQRALNLMERPGFDKDLLDILLPFANAILRLLNREIAQIQRDKVEDANDAYKALAAVQDDQDEAFHDAVRRRRNLEGGDAK